MSTDFKECDVQVRGSLSYSSKDIIEEHNEIKIFRGMLGKRHVAVKRFSQSHRNEALREIDTLIPSDVHPNIIQLYTSEHVKNTTYVCLERWEYNLPDFVEKFPNKKCSLTTFQLQLMRDIVSGLAHLHKLKIVYDDFKPENILITEGKNQPENILIIDGKNRCAKLSTMNAIEVSDENFNERQQKDLLKLASVLFFIMTNGMEMEVVDTFFLVHIPEAYDLICALKNGYCNNAKQVLQHPMFWNSDMRLSFFRQVSDRLEVELTYMKNGFGLKGAMIAEIRNIGLVILKARIGKDWSRYFKQILRDLENSRNYAYGEVGSLLRLIRNTINHYRDFSLSNQTLVGSFPEGIDKYFTKKIPELLIEVYKVMYKHCWEEDEFKKYFKCSVLYAYE